MIRDSAVMDVVCGSEVGGRSRSEVVIAGRYG
jgi:hypothetical protein